MEDAMQRLVYFIFIMPFTQSFAMKTLLPGSSAPGNRVITVANITHHGVTVQIDQKDDRKLWIGTTARGQIEVSPPHSPRVLHDLVVCDTNETATLAQAQFEHPQEEGTLFQVFLSGGVVKVEQTEDPTNPVKKIRQPNDTLQVVKSIQSTEPTYSLMRTMALPTAGALVLVLALLAAKKYAATE